VNNLLKVITRQKGQRRDLNLQPVDPETSTLTTLPPRFTTDHVIAIGNKFTGNSGSVLLHYEQLSVSQ